MSSEAHGDAEETIRYFVGRLQSQEVFEAMALETVWNSRLFLYYGVAVFWTPRFFTLAATVLRNPAPTSPGFVQTWSRSSGRSQNTPVLEPAKRLAGEDA